MKTPRHKYNIGDVVEFKFLTGNIFTGKITEHTFKDEDTPTYKIRVEEKIGRVGFTIYPCMTDSRIIKLKHTAIQNMKIEEKAYKDSISKQREKTRISEIEKKSLKKAFEAQQDFISGNIQEE